MLLSQKLFSWFENKHVFLLACLVLILLKLFLVGGQRIFFMPFAVHDDGLFANNAYAISNGGWLGAYNQLTLAKGAFFPVWLAFLNFFSIPVLTGNQILYILACTFLIVALKPIFKSRLHELICFAFLLFNPITLGEVTMLRIIRDAMNHSLIMIIFAGFIGMFMYRDDKKRMLGFSLICGLALGAAWHTREDTFWVLPFAIVACIITALFIVFEKNNVLIKSAFLLIPFVFIFLSNVVIAEINHIAYGRRVVNDFRSRDFQSAYGALLRIAHDEFSYQIPVPTDARMRAYEVSPAFAELKYYLDGERLSGWKGPGPDTDDFNGGWFFWALRDAVALVGYYDHPLYAQEFYERMARELNYALDSGLIPARTGRRSSLAPPFEQRHIAPVAHYTWQSALFVTRFDGFSMRHGLYYFSPMPEDEDYFALIRQGETFFNQLSQYGIPPANEINLATTRMIHRIVRVYGWITPVLSVLSLLTLAYLTIARKFQFYREGIIMWGLFMAFMARNVMVAFVHVTSFPAINTLYLSSSYFLVLLFNILGVSCIAALGMDIIAKGQIYE